MPCFYPEGDPADWCQRHVSEASLQAPAHKRAHA